MPLTPYYRPPNDVYRTVAESAPNTWGYWTRADIDALTLGLSSDQSYYSVQENISADKTYTPTFIGSDLILYVSKPVVVRLNSVANDAIALAANVGLKLEYFEITSVLLSSVPPNTDVNLIITG